MIGAQARPRRATANRHPEMPRVLKAYHGISTGQNSNRKKPQS